MGVTPDAPGYRSVDDRHMSSSRPNATHVEVIIEEGTIRGVVRDRNQRETPFQGWLSLIAAVEACRLADRGDSPAPGPSDNRRESTGFPLDERDG